MRKLLAHSGWSLGVLLTILQCTAPPPTKNYPAPTNVSSAQVEKPCLAPREREKLRMEKRGSCMLFFPVTRTQQVISKVRNSF